RRLEPRGHDRPGDPAARPPGREDPSAPPQRPRRTGDPRPVPRRGRARAGGPRVAAGPRRARDLRRGPRHRLRARGVRRRRPRHPPLPRLRLRGDAAQHRGPGEEARREGPDRHRRDRRRLRAPDRGDPGRVRGERGHALGRPRRGLGAGDRTARPLPPPGRGRGPVAGPHAARGRRRCRGGLRVTEQNRPALTTERVMGIETEFGVLHADVEDRACAGAGSSILLSHLVVGAYALLDPAEGERGRRVRWDYGDETPLRDARGFEMQRAAAHPTQLTDEVRDAHVPSVELDAPVTGPEVAPEGDDAEVLAWASQRSIGNAVLRNGARWYVDHAHPEYSAPEVLRAREAVVVDRAGEEIARRAMGILAGAEGIPEVALYKNNTDGKGQSYGTHENYLVDREVPFER